MNSFTLIDKNTFSPKYSEVQLIRWPTGPTKSGLNSESVLIVSHKYNEMKWYLCWEVIVLLSKTDSRSSRQVFISIGFKSWTLMFKGNIFFPLIKTIRSPVHLFQVVWDVQVEAVITYRCLTDLFLYTTYQLLVFQ